LEVNKAKRKVLRIFAVHVQKKHHGKHGQKFHPIAQTDGSQIFLVELIKDYTQLPVAYLDDHSFKAISESIFPPFSSISKGK
jgi:hypothetical protein